MVSLSTGPGSVQNYRTPANFMEACARKFGPIGFDLAAEPHNKQHDRYFGPAEFVEKGNSDELGIQWQGKGYPIPPGVKLLKVDKKKGPIFERRTPNVDPAAVALDSLKQDWAGLNMDHGPPVRPLLFLNPPFSDIEPWARKCARESNRGAEILFLVPASVGADWFVEYVYPNAHVLLLHGRLCFDGKDPYPKDCLLAHFQDMTRQPPLFMEVLPPLVQVWNWRAA
jgi:hypothetical protein